MSYAGEMMSSTATVSPSARPEREHRAADDAAAAERQHDGPDHAPAGAAERHGRLALADRRLGEHAAHDRAGQRDRPSSTTASPAMNAEPV